MKVSIAILLSLLLSSFVYCQQVSSTTPVVSSTSGQPVSEQTTPTEIVQSKQGQVQQDTKEPEGIENESDQEEESVEEKGVEKQTVNSINASPDQVPQAQGAEKNLKSEDVLEEQEEESIKEKVTKVSQQPKTPKPQVKTAQKKQDTTPKPEPKTPEAPKQAEPAKQVEPAKPVKPEDPAKPTQPTKPVDPVKKPEQKSTKVEQKPKKLQQKTVKPAQTSAKPAQKPKDTPSKPEQKPKETPVKAEQKPSQTPKQDPKVEQPIQEKQPQTSSPQAPIDTATFKPKPVPTPQQKTAATNPRHNPSVQNQIQIPDDKNTPFYCGRATFMRSTQPRTRLDPQQGDQLVKTNYGFDMYINSKDFSVANIIAISGTWQPQYINLIGHIVKQGNTVLNIGVQSGLSALVIGKIIGDNGKLYVIQPYTTEYDLFNKNVQLNGLKKITTTYKKLASDAKSNGTVVLQGQMGRRFPFMNPNMGVGMVPPGFMMTPQGLSGSPMKPGQRPSPQQLMINRTSPNPFMQQSQKVQADQVDSILPAGTKVDFALIDVQKNQIKTLKGMKKLIQNSPNLVMMVQWQFASNRQSNKQQAKQVLDFIISKGYKIYTYSGGNIVTCQVGSFHQFRDVENLFRINRISIFLFPKTVPVPK